MSASSYLDARIMNAKAEGSSVVLLLGAEHLQDPTQVPLTIKDLTEPYQLKAVMCEIVAVEWMSYSESAGAQVYEYIIIKQRSGLQDLLDIKIFGA